MKKILSISFAVTMACTAFSQTVWEENFETYNLGNLDSQQGWARDGGGDASWTQIKSIDVTHGKSFQMGSTDSNSEGVFQYHDTNWSAKNAENNIFVLEFDHYTGVARSGVNALQIYDVDNDYAMAIEFAWNSYEKYLYIKDKTRAGIIIQQNATDNTWYHIKLSYDTVTGKIKVQVNSAAISTFDAVAGYQPTELDVLVYAVTNGAYDNIKVSATNIDPFLAVSDVSNTKAKVSVYPNPVTDVINVKSDNKISQVSIFDVSGKMVKTSAENSVNVQNLAKGSYVVSIKFTDGTTETKKVIKK